MGLIAGGAGDSASAARGVEFLNRTQKPDGSWDEPWFTGTGFPKVFYLRYHLYRAYFPVFALSMYARAHELDGWTLRSGVDPLRAAAIGKGELR